MFDVGLSMKIGEAMAQEGRVFHIQVDSFESEAQSEERLPGPDGLEYILQLISSHFLYVVPQEYFIPSDEVDGKQVHPRSLTVFSFPFNNETDKSQIGLWNDIVTKVEADFQNRRDVALRGKCTWEKLEDMVRNCIEDFEFEDRKRLDVEKLTNLAVFVYDYCMLTLTEAHLYNMLDTYVDGTVEIRGKEFRAPVRVCASISHYLSNGCVFHDLEVGLIPKKDLPSVRLKTTVQNPHTSDSYLSAMFVDLMHKFFLSFGLKKFGKSEWAKPERMLIYELLRLFGFCKSSKPAAESKYVTTVVNDYGDYFTRCNLRTWLREDQAYCDIMCCTIDQFCPRFPAIKTPFLDPMDYIEEEAGESVTPERQTIETEERIRIKFSELPPEVQAQMPRGLLEMSGRTLRITHASHARVRYGSVGIEHTAEETIEWNPRLDYVKALVESSFEYISSFAYGPCYIVARQNLKDPFIASRLASFMERDLLNRVDAIPRGLFAPDDVMPIIADFREHLATKEERSRTDVDKLYVLFLFIFTYVYLTYKESVMDPHLRLYIPSAVNISRRSYKSTVLIDDMLTAFLENPYTFTSSSDESHIFQQLRIPEVYVPEKNYPLADPSCSVKNMTAMFFDLFARFFKIFGLTRRSDVKVVSDLESTFIGELAISSGICSAKNPASARTMFMMNKDYFKKSSLELSIRENEYGYLFLNTMSEELFGPKTEADK